MSTVRREQGAGELAAEHRSWLLGQALKMSRTRDEAEDLVQETFARFIDRYRNETHLPDRKTSGLLLTRMLANVFNDQYRRRKVREQNARDPLLRNRLHGEPEPEEPLASATISVEDVAKALQEFSPQMQKTYALMAEGKPYKEIALDCGITAGTVRKRIHDIRMKLRALLSAGRN